MRPDGPHPFGAALRALARNENLGRVATARDWRRGPYYRARRALRELLTRADLRAETVGLCGPDGPHPFGAALRSVNTDGELGAHGHGTLTKARGHITEFLRALSHPVVART